AALVRGTKPKSYGKTIPSGRIFDRLNIFFAGSYLSLLRLPRGVSIVTLRMTGRVAAARFAAPAVLRFMGFSCFLHPSSLADASQTGGRGTPALVFFLSGRDLWR